MLFPEAGRKERLTEWLAREWPVFSEQLDRFISRNASCFLVGPSFRPADLVWYAAVTMLEGMGIPRASFVTKLQQQFLEAVESIPGIAAFLKSDKNPKK